MLDIFVFEVGGVRYGIPLADTGELFRAPSLVPLPRAPAIVEGVVNLRGRIVPVLDIRKRFGLAPKPPHPSDHIVVMKAANRQVGFRVDSATGLAAVLPDDVAEAKAVTPRAEYLAGIAKLPDGLVLIHDPATFLTTSEGQGLDAALAAEPSGQA